MGVYSISGVSKCRAAGLVLSVYWLYERDEGKESVAL